MKWISSRGQSPPVSFVDALFAGTAPDGGLYVPERLDPLPATTLQRLGGASLVEIATAVGTHLFRDEISELAFGALVRDALNFDVPLRGSPGNLLEVVTLTGVTGGVYIDCQGFTAP